MATHSSTLAWKIPWTERPGRLQSMESLGVGYTERLHFHFSLSCIGEGNGNPLQCSCLENPRDGEAWWAAIYGVAESWTRLKWLSSSSSSILTGVRYIALWFWFVSPWWLVMLRIFCIPAGHLYLFFQKMSIQVLCPFLTGSSFWY